LCKKRDKVTEWLSAKSIQSAEMGNLIRVGEAVEVAPGIKKAKLKASPASPTQMRLILSPAAKQEESPEAILYQHSALCQTCLPYRDPGDEVLVWERANGYARIRLESGPALHPETGEFVRFGLPYGPKPRLILAHLNAEALRTNSNVIDVSASLTAFMSRLGLDTNGRNMNAVKEQLARLSTTIIFIGHLGDQASDTDTASIVKGFRLWMPKKGHRVLWPQTVKLSLEYYASLQKHAVPLNEAAVGALAHSAMGLDIYAWLAQRLHRIPLGNPAFVPWTALQGQFGWQYERIRDFRRVFLVALKQVMTQYPAAKFNVDPRGMKLFHSQPPVPSRLMLMAGR
jgi:replication initiator protein